MLESRARIQGIMRPCLKMSTNNQQERLIRLQGWIVGFTDGEGCFSIGFIKQVDRKEDNRIRRGYKTGYQVFHEFAVTQGESSLPSLKEMKKFFGVGRIYVNKRYDNHTEHLYRYVVRKREELLDVIVPFFMQHRLRTTKLEDFKKFVRCLQLVNKNKHLEQDGLVAIAKIAEKMNRKKSGKNLMRILRDSTSCSTSASG
jgi:hypothetical protein